MTISFATNKLIENVSMAASFQSDKIPLPRRTSYSIHAVFTGSPTGSLYIAVSIDGDNWTVLDDSPQAITEAGDVFFNVMTAGYLFARLQYAFSSGSGTMNAFFSAKEVS